MQASPLFKLTMRQGPRPDQTFELVKDVYTVGREAGNDIIINDPQVSRHHARLTLQVSTYVLEDLGSTNGTFVNGRRVSGPASLSIGDMVGLGDTVGELRRFALENLRRGDTRVAWSYLEKMERILDALMRFDYPTSLVALKRKQDIARGLIEKTRGEVAVAARSQELAEKLDAVRGKL